MRWVAIFEDTPDMMSVRAVHGQDHLDYLLAHEAEIVLAGGLREEVGAGFVGGLWVLEVASRERAMELVQQDPYFIHGARRVTLRLWGKAFADRSVLL